MVKLRECPFCGTIPTGDINDIVYPVGTLKDVYQCVCSNPDCGGTVLGWNVTSAIEAWNNRSTDDLTDHQKMRLEIVDNIVIELREELTNAYNHIGVLTNQLDKSLERQYDLEIENDRRDTFNKKGF